jgi:serine protease
MQTALQKWVVPFRLLCLAMALDCLFVLPSVAADGRKPDRTFLQPGQDPTRIAVKFRDGLYIRLRNNALVSTNTQTLASARALLNKLSSGQWARADVISEDAIDDMRHRAEQNLGRSLPDMNLQFYLTLPPGMDAGEVIDQLNQLDIVDLAQPVPIAVRPPLPPDFQPQQVYSDPAPTGGGVFDVWTNYGVFGADVRVADVEYSFNSNHMDLPSIVNLTPDAVDPFDDNDHGTATLGEIAALQNGWGTTGVAYGASLYFAGANYADGYNVGAGITTAASSLRAGDILMIEQQIDGPNTTEGVEQTGGEYGLVPVDWYEPYYNAVTMAVGLGIIVIETADNGGQNLDDPIYSTGNGGNWPFLPQNRSGAIFVGAGASFNGSSTESSRLYYANYGSCVDMQNWGENIVTIGYGDLYSAEGPNLYYTATFSGTSGATPIVVGEVALLQSIYENATGQVLTALQIKTLLRNTGSPQTSGTYPVFDNIGPLPNLPGAVQIALSNSGPPVVVMHTTNAEAVIGGTMTLSVAASGKQPLSYRWSFNNAALTDGGNVFGSSTADLVLNNLTAAEAGSYSVSVSNTSGKVSATSVLSVVSDPWLTPGVTVSNLYSFTAAYDGEGPTGLTPDGSGDFFGVEQYGGTNGWGGVFEFTPATTNFTVIWSFNDTNDGAEPYAPMVLSQDGNFYGTSSGDDNTNYGSIFSVDQFGDFYPIYAFTGGNDGGSPSGTLVEISYELFCGTTYSGGFDNQGVIFTMDPYGDENVLHNFTYADGAGANGGLVLAGDGLYYGMTDWGGTNGLGTIFRINPNAADPDQTFQSLFSFNGANGENPFDDLTVGMDGKLYGRTSGGGVYGQGTVFSFSTNGVFEPLFSFDGTNGSGPDSTLFAGNDGNFYAVTSSGGTNGDGVIYEITPAGGFSIIAYFNGDNGLHGSSPLVRNIDGNFCGATFNGGSYGSGNIFELSFDSTAAPAFQGVSKGSGQIDLTASGVAGRAYQLQSTPNLGSGDWTPLGTPVTASNDVFTVTDTLPSNGDKFYRLKLVLP